MDCVYSTPHSPPENPARVEAITVRAKDGMRLSFTPRNGGRVVGGSK